VIFRALRLTRDHLLGTTHSNKFYEMADGKATDLRLKFTMFGKPQHVEMRYISNQPITEQEYDRWRRTIAESRKPRLLFPSERALQKKQDSLRDWLEQPLSSEDVRELLKAKKQSAEAFRAAKSGAADSQETSERPSSTNTPRDPRANGAVVGSQNGVPQRIDQITMAAMNEKNRRSERDRILDAEKRHAAAKRAAVSANGSAANTAPGSAFGTPKQGSGNITPSLGSVLQGGSMASSTQQIASKLEAMGKSELASSAVMQVDVDLGDF
jgi:Plus-3 domain